MLSPHLGRRYGLDVEKGVSVQQLPAKSLHDYSESETDETDIEDILPQWTQTQHRNPTRVPVLSQTPVHNETVTPSTTQQPFRLEGDIPKKRMHNRGFHPIRPMKRKEPDTDSDESKKNPSALRSGSPSGSEDQRPSTSRRKRACAACRKKKHTCHHKKTVLGLSQSRRAAPRSASDPLPSSHKGARTFKVEKNDAKPRNGSKEYSMSKTAVDFRERKKLQAEYQEELAELLDDDVVQQVEMEGGITPLGRLFKAAVQMLQRVKEIRALNAQENETATYQPTASDDRKVPIAKLKQMQRNAREAQQKIENLNQAIRDLVEADQLI